MRCRLLPITLALLASVAMGPQARAQNAPEWPGLRGLNELRLYVGFTGRPEALAACGITPEVEQATFDAMRLLPEGAGIRITTPQAERVQVPNSQTHVLIGRPTNPEVPSIGFSVVVLAVTQNNQTFCTLATDMAVRAPATGSRITASGVVLDGPLQVWHDDETDLIAAASARNELRTSIEDGLRNLIRAWQAANGRPQSAAPAPPQQPAPPPAPPANAPRVGGSKG